MNLSEEDGFTKLKGEVSRTLSNIAPLPFGEAVSKLSDEYTDAISLTERYELDAKKFPVLDCVGGLLERAKTTRREMQVVSWMLQHQKDRPTLKHKLGVERKLAKKEEVEGLLNPCLLSLMVKAEMGKDIASA